MKKINGYLIFVMAFSLLTACSNNVGKQEDTVAIKAVVLPYTSFGPFFIAQEDGYFAEQNLNVEFVRFDSGTSPLPLLAEGEVDVLGSGPSIGLFNAIANGSAIRVVADKGYLAGDGCTYMALLASNVWTNQSQNQTAEALKGARVSIDPINFEAFMFDKVLRSKGLSLQDIYAQDVAPPALADAVQNNAVDLISVGDPWIIRLIETGQVSVWQPYQEIVPDMQFGFVLFGPSLYRDNPEAGVRFLAAYLKGVKQYNEGKTTRNLEIMAKYTKLDTETLKKACWPPISVSGQINLQTIDEYQAWAVDQGLIDNVVPDEKYWIPSFVEKATQLMK
jgi:NitT/TauT family transport system substrate-binding protein